MDNWLYSFVLCIVSDCSCVVNMFFVSLSINMLSFSSSICAECVCLQMCQKQVVPSKLTVCPITQQYITNNDCLFNHLATLVMNE